MHRLLRYQVAKTTGPDGTIDVQALLSLVNAAYSEADRWRRRTHQATLQMCAEMEQLNIELTRLAHYDALTELPNRVLFQDRLHQALAAAEREQGQVGLLYLDLDHFKTVNDTLGHAAGDALLREVSDRFRKCLRQSDTICRLGGDEFAVVLPRVGSRQDAAALALRLIGTLRAPIPIEDTLVQVGASIGIAINRVGKRPVPPTEPMAENAADATPKLLAVAAIQIMKDADIALYEAKNAGRNRFRFFIPAEAAELDTPPRRVVTAAVDPALDYQL